MSGSIRTHPPDKERACGRETDATGSASARSRSYRSHASMDRVERFCLVSHRMSAPNRRLTERCWGGSPGPHVLLPRAVDSPHSGNPPGGQGSVRARILWISGFDPEPTGGPSQTTFACALKDLSRSVIELGPRVPTDGPNRVGRRSRHAREGERSQPIRGAALANGMAAVWGDRFMGWTWTWNQSRRQTRRRHRPMLEHLDDRCLLSTSAGIKLADHVVSHAVDRRHALVRHLHAGSAHTEVTHRMVGHQVSIPKW